MSTPTTSPPNQQEQRIEKLEQTVATLQAQVAQLHAATIKSGKRPSPQGEVAARLPNVAPPIMEEKEMEVGEEKRPFIPAHLRQSEFWLNKIGIGLLLFALIFLFKFAVDEGWLTPAVRLAIGMLIGTTLLVFGLRLYRSRRAFSVVLLGGSIGSYYITGFAAFSLYNLVPHPAAFGFMIVVTLLAFFLSLRQDEAVLSLIGTFGGLLTPIMLDSGSGNIDGLLLYTVLVVGGVVAVYFIRGWRVLLWFVAMGAWAIILYSLGEANSYYSDVVVRPWVLQGTIWFTWIVFWMLPLARYLIDSIGNWRLPPLSLGVADNLLPSPVTRWLGIDLHGFTFTTALLVMFTSQAVWDITDNQRGWTFVGAAIVYAAVAFYLCTQPRHLNLGITHALTSTVLLTIGFLIMLDDEWLLVALTLEAIVWHLLNSRWQKTAVSIGTHLFSMIVGGALLVRLLTPVGGDGETAVRLLADLFIIASFVGVAWTVLPRIAKRIYLTLAHIAILLLLWRELSPLNNGQVLISVTWGIYAVTLLIIGLRKNNNLLRIVGLITLFLLVGKLFVVDLEQVKTIWRIVLFFGFGGLFLLLSYFYQRLWQTDEIE